MGEISRLNDCLTHIEENLIEHLSLDDLAKIFGTSRFHFQRMFQIITSFTVHEYIRNRRLTKAAQELHATNQKVIDIGLKYGYETAESFSKAFRKLHGISPREAKKGTKILKAFPPLSFEINIRGEHNMDYRIMENKAFKVVGKGISITKNNGENFSRIPKFWTEVNNGEIGKKLMKYESHHGMFGICMDFDLHTDTFTYFIGTEKGDRDVLEGLEEREIPTSTWAVFRVIGPMPTAIQDAWVKIYSEWFQATGYEHAGTPEMEVYPPSDFDISDENYETEIWVPVQKRG